MAGHSTYRFKALRFFTKRQRAAPEFHFVSPEAPGCALSDRFGGGAEIRWALVSLIVFVGWAAIHYLLGARTYLRDLEAKNA